MNIRNKLFGTIAIALLGLTSAWATTASIGVRAKKGKLVANGKSCTKTSSGCSTGIVMQKVNSAFCITLTIACGNQSCGPETICNVEGGEPIHMSCAGMDFEIKPENGSWENAFQSTNPCHAIDVDKT